MAKYFIRQLFSKRIAVQTTLLIWGLAAFGLVIGAFGFAFQLFLTGLLPFGIFLWRVRQDGNAGCVTVQDIQERGPTAVTPRSSSDLFVPPSLD